MEELSTVAGILKASIIKNDIIILGFAIICAIIMIVSFALAKSVDKRKKDWIRQRNSTFTKYILNGLRVFYTLFVTLITIFPLLGMLGTVFGLLGLDLATGDMENIKNNFFIALTSTAWGIIFSVIFKVCHALVADFIEEQIEVAKKLTDEMIGIS